MKLGLMLDGERPEMGIRREIAGRAERLEKAEHDIRVARACTREPDFLA